MNLSTFPIAPCMEANKLLREICKSGGLFAIAAVPRGMVEPHEAAITQLTGFTLDNLFSQAGGLAPDELCAVLERRAFYEMDAAESHLRLRLHISRYFSGKS